MKILHIVPFYKPAYIYGGPIASVSKLCESEQFAGADVYVLTTDANGKREKLSVYTNGYSMVDQVKVYYFASLTNDNTFVSFKLWGHLYKHCRDFDIVHIHTWWNFLALVSTFICKIRKVKVVLSPRGMLSEYIFNSTNSGIKKALHRIFGKALLRSTVFNATSEQEYKECKLLIKDWCGFILPNILELPEVDLVKRDNEVFTLSFLSRIDPKKGLEFVFQAIAMLDFEVRFRVAGNGDERYVLELKSLAKSLDIEEQIEWVGWLGPGQKFNELMAADLFVLTSHNENFANVVVESLYCATPVLISKHVGLADYVLRNGLGWVTDLDAVSIAAAISECRNSPKQANSIKSTARLRIVEDFSAEALSKKYLQAYAKAVNDSVKIDGL